MKTALEQAAENLKLSIAAREASPDKSPNFVGVTNIEKARLAEVLAAIQSEKPTAAAK